MTDIETSSSPQVDDGTPPSRLRAVLRWRDWKLSTRFAAAMLVPVVFAIVLGVVEIANESERAATFERVDRAVVADEKVRELAAVLRNERQESAVALLNNNGQDRAAQLKKVRDAVDTSWAGTKKAADRATFVNDSTANVYGTLKAALSELPAVRAAVNKAEIPAVSTVAKYGTMTKAATQFGRTLVAEAGQPELNIKAGMLYDLEVVEEELSYQHSMIAIGISQQNLNVGDTAGLRDSYARMWLAISDGQTIADPEYRKLIFSGLNSPQVAERSRLFQIAVGLPNTPLPITAEEWNTSSIGVQKFIGGLTDRVAGELRSASGVLRDEASDEAGIAAVALLGLIVLAAAMLILILRNLLQSLRTLRDGALHVANQELPRAVEEIRAGRIDSSADPSVAPVPVHSRDEVGQVARAFDAVHVQALRLAAAEAGVRANFSAVFVNLSRRSQGLVQRQLRLLENLERDEEDAEQLATLFQLDHLATRMRRNNENLMVLSGSDLGRRTSQPMALQDLLRAAVSEVEQYQRIVVQPAPNRQIVGYAAGDLGRLIAELLDNATAYSAPDTEVTISSRALEGGALLVEVADHGIGMSDEDLAEANQRLAEGGSVDASTSRRMGLFVIGRLASRHGIGVQLVRGRGVPGIRAEVTVPVEVVIGSELDTPAGGFAATRTDIPAQAEAPADSHAFDMINGAEATTALTGNELPRRTPGRNGAVQQEIADRLLGGDQNGTNLFDGPADDAPANDAPAVSELMQERGTEAVLPRRTPRRPRGTDPLEGTPAPPPPSRDTGHDGAELPVRGGVPSFGVSLSSPGSAGDIDSPGGLFLPSVSDEQPEEPAPPRRAEPVVPAIDGPPAFETEHQVDSHSGEFSPEEMTPIFAQMLSAWFSEPAEESSEEPSSPAKAKPRSPGEDTKTNLERVGDLFSAEFTQRFARPVWQSAADEGWQAAEAQANQEPEVFTEAGLPKRAPKERLLPGSIGPALTEPTPSKPVQPLPPRDADAVRSRLSSFQRGVSKARQGEQLGPPPPLRAPARPNPEQAQPAQAAPTPPPPTSDNGAAALSQVRRTPGRGRTSNRPWHSPADEGWRAVAAASETAPTETTSAGLPRRSPKERLLPGSVRTSKADARPVQRNAEELRGRLGSLQRGIDRGRRSVAQRASAPGENQHERENQ